MKNRKKIVIALLPISLLIIILLISSLDNSEDNNQLGVNSSFSYAPIAIPEDKDFTIRTLLGDQISKRDYSGKIIILDFWSSWCIPCIQEGPVLSNLSKEWSDRNVQFIGVSVWDTKENVLDFIKQNDIQYPNAIDKNGQIAIDFGVRGIPEKIIIDSKGKIIHRIIGPSTKPSLEKILDQLTTEILKNN